MQIPAIVTTARNQAIIDAVVAAKFVVIDDHKSSLPGDHTLKLGGVGVYERNEVQHVVALFTGSFSDYYCINRVNVDRDGSVHLTRDNCGGLVTDATDDITADIQRMYDNVSWERVAKYPSIAPGAINNIVVA